MKYCSKSMDIYRFQYDALYALDISLQLGILEKREDLYCIFASGIPGLLLCYGRIGGDTVLKIRKIKLEIKCQSDKYYASIKYMAHSLRGKDRENFYYYSL